MSGLNLLRQKYPDHLADLNDYEAVNKIAELTGQKPDAVASDLGVQMPTIAREFAKGISSGVDQIQGSLYGAGALAADLVGADRVRDWAMEGAQRNQLEAQETAAAVDDIRKIGGLRDGLLWTGHVVGAQVPQLVGSLTPAGLGARYAGKKALASALEQGLSKEAAQAAAAKAAGLGAYAGGGAYGATMESGDNFLSIYDRTGEYQPGNALAHGVPAVALEGLSDRFLLKGVGAGRPAGMSRTAYVGQQAGQQAAISGVLEEVPQDLLAQHALDVAAPGYEYDGWRTANAAAAGAVGGGAIGGAFATLTPSEKTYAKVGDVARDPVGAGIDVYHGMVAKSATKQAREDISAGRTPTPFQNIQAEELQRSKDEAFFEPAGKDTDDATLSANMKREADYWKKKILTAQSHSLGPQEEALRAASAQYGSDGDWMKYRGELKKHRIIEERNSLMDTFKPEGAKFSEMTPEGEELTTLSNAWLKNEGKQYGPYFDDDSDSAKALGAKLFGWIKADFGKQYTENGDIFIPRAFIEALGDRAPGVVQSAITAARKEGWDIKDAGDAVKAVRDYVSSHEGDTSFLTSALRYSQQGNWTPKMIQRYAKELRQSGGRLDKEDYKWLKSQVTDPVAVLEHFQKPSKFYKAEKNQELRSGSPKAPTDMDVDGESLEVSIDRDGDYVTESSDASAGITDNDGDWNSSVSEFDGDSKPTFIGNTLDGRPFDTADERQVAKKNTKLGQFANDPAVFAREIGVWQQVKLAAKGDKARLAEYEDSLINEFGNDLSEADFQGLLNPVDLTDNERRAVLGQINKRFRVVEVEGVVPDKDPHKIPKEDIKTFRVDGVTDNRRSPEKETAKNGFIFLERKIGNKVSYFPTTTARLLQHIRGNRRLDKEGAANVERDVKVDGKNKGAAGALSHLEQAIADLISSDNTFTGRIGYKMRGDAKEPIWIEGQKRLPGFLPLGDGVSTANDGYRGRQYEAMRKGHTEVDVDDGPKEIATETNIDFTTANHFATTDPSTGHKIGSKRQAEAVAQSLRGTYADVVGSEKRNGQWGVSYNTRVETRSTNHLSEGDEMSIASSKKFERTVREFQEETGVSLEVDVPYARRSMIGRVLQNARVAWALADVGQRKQLKKLIDDKNYFSANKLADTIRFSSEGVKDVEVSENGHKQVPSDARGADQGGRPGVRETEIVPRADPILQSGNRTGAGANTQAGKADSNRDVGARNTNRGEVTDESGIQRDSDKGDLESYLDQHGSKTAVWAAAARNALASGNEKQIAGALAAAKKQFGELAAGQKAELKDQASEQAKQDAWVMKVASMSMKDMRAYINALPKEKLEAAYDLIEGFNPDNFKNSTQERVAAEALDVLRDRLDGEGGETKYSEQNTGETNEQPNRQTEQAGGRGVESSQLLGVAGGVEELVAKHGKAFARRIAEISRTFRFENPNEQVSHDTALGNFQGYATISSYVPEQGMFIMYVMPEASATEARSYFKDAGAEGVKMTQTLRNRILGHTAIMRLGYDPSTNEFVWLSADKGSFGESVLAQNNMLDAPTVDRSGRELNKTKGLKFAQITKLLGEFHARLRDANGGEEVAINWDRYTGANTEKKGGTQFSEQTADQTPITPEQALADIARMLGKGYDAQVVADLGGKAGQWTPRGIRLAATAPNGTQYHEALHELFSQLRKHGAENVVKVIERVTQNPIIMRKLEQLLEGHPKAKAQLKTPEEAAAFLFQFWNMGLINIGPETKTLFQTIKDWLVEVAKDIHAIINNAKRDERKAEKAQKLDEQKVRDLFDAFASGVAANPDSRQALYDALRKNAEVHQKTIDELGMRAERFWQGIGRYVISSESMLNSYSKHPELKIIADAFHQMAGKSMKNMARDPSLDARGGFFEATHQESQRRLAKFERFLERGNYDQKDFEIALKYLESGKGNSSDAKIAKLVDFIRDYHSEMFDYITKSDVRRLDPTSEQRWVPVEKRKNYWSQVWNVEGLMDNHDGFVADLLAAHPRELQHMADEANKEIEAWEKMTNTTGKVKSPTAQAGIDKKLKEFNESGQIIGKVTYDKITPEAVAETIYTRLINSMGMVDMQETEWSLGITPGASAVNRRQLDWLDKEVFSKYKSKDLVNIVTTYTRTMVKRAESQKRFGYGGERISDAVDTAFLREMGGQELVNEAVAELPEAIKQWKKDAAEWHEDNQGVPYPEPYPTLRLVGVETHRAKVGAEASNKALIAAEEALRPVVNAIRAQEGTLGNEISPTMRAANSWINTYTNIRLLPFALFTNLSDVIGITAQGGTLGDAWNAFVGGMREVRNTWINKKGDDSDTLRAEDWGVVDAGLLLDTLGQSYGSVYMTHKAQRINNRFFRIIGMEGWNRGIRVTAAKVGERIISDWATKGVDFSKPGEKSRFERLYGKGANPKAIKLDSQGRLDTSNAANRAAIQRFVQDAVMSSNAAHRTFWMSDPRFATFAHLKNYAYTFHSVMLKNIIDQGMQGNLRPALAAGLGYASIAIAAGAVKEMLIPGDEPFWMKGGLDGYIDYGLGQANLGGVPQLWAEGVTDLDPAKLAGPFWDQLQNLVSSPLPGFSLNLSPFDGDTEVLRDRKVLVEMARAIPPATLTGRGMDSLVGD